MTTAPQTTVPERPLFRYDLETEAVQEGSERFVDVSDPETGEALRLYEVEYAVACGMDGGRDLDSLVTWAGAELGLETSRDELEKVIQALAERGYLEEAEAARADARSADARSADARSADARSADARSADARSADARSADARSADARSADARSADARSADARSADARSADARSADARSADARSADARNAAPEAPRAATAPMSASSRAETSPPAAAGSPRQATSPPARVDTGAPSFLEAPAEDDETSVYRSGDARMERVVDEVGEVALGFSGRSPIEREARESGGDATEIELGFAGKSEVEAPPAAAPTGASDFELGFAGGPSAAEKEAAEARRSSEADAVDELAVARAQTKVDAPRAGTAAAEASTSRPATTESAAEASTSRPVTAESAASESRSTGEQPIVIPAATAAAASPAAASPAAASPAAGRSDAPARQPTTAPREGSASTLLWLLLLVALGAGGYFAYNELVLERRPESPPPVPAPQATAEMAPVPAAPTALLVAEEDATVELTAPAGGSVVWLAEAGLPAAPGDVIVRLRGYEALEKKRAAAEEAQARAQTQLDEATAEDNKKRMATAQASADRKASELEELSAALAALVIESPVTGVIEPRVELGAEVGEGEVVAVVTEERGPTATFELTGPAALSAGAEVDLEAAGDPETRATCEVVSAEGSVVTVRCSPESGLQGGTTVVLSP